MEDFQDAMQRLDLLRLVSRDATTPGPEDGSVLAIQLSRPSVIIPIPEAITDLAQEVNCSSGGILRSVYNEILKVWADVENKILATRAVGSGEQFII